MFVTWLWLIIKIIVAPGPHWRHKVVRNIGNSYFYSFYILLEPYSVKKTGNRSWDENNESVWCWTFDDIVSIGLKYVKWNVFSKATTSAWVRGSREWHPVSCFHYDINILYNAVHFSIYWMLCDYVSLIFSWSFFY